MLRKVLWCLPSSKWGTKVTAIDEAQDPRNLKIDDLVEKLLTNEIHPHEESDEQVLKQGISLKSIDDDFETQSEQFGDEDDKSVIMVARVFKKMFEKKNHNSNDFGKY